MTLLLHYHYTSNVNVYQTFSMHSCIIFNHAWQISGKSYKKQRNVTSFFQVILGSERITGRKEREIKISKFRFLCFYFYLYIILWILSRLFIVPERQCTFLLESFRYFLFLLTLAPFVNLSVDTLAKAKRLTHFYSVAPLLEKRFACFPSFGDGLRSAFYSFMTIIK